ncbi:hypothetical protein PSPO01_15356 [Paraphaeosphaeria sporulosa]
MVFSLVAHQLVFRKILHATLVKENESRQEVDEIEERLPKAHLVRTILLSFLELELELSVCPLAGKSSASTIILRGSIEYSALVLCAVSSYLLGAQQRMIAAFFATAVQLIVEVPDCSWMPPLHSRSDLDIDRSGPIAIPIDGFQSMILPSVELSTARFVNFTFVLAASATGIWSPIAVFPRLRYSGTSVDVIRLRWRIPPWLRTKQLVARLLFAITTDRGYSDCDKSSISSWCATAERLEEQARRQLASLPATTPRYLSRSLLHLMLSPEALMAEP